MLCTQIFHVSMKDGISDQEKKRKATWHHNVTCTHTESHKTWCTKSSKFCAYQKKKKNSKFCLIIYFNY